MRITAAVLREQSAPLSIEPLELDAPGAGEVLVERYRRSRTPKAALGVSFSKRVVLRQTRGAVLQ